MVLNRSAAGLLIIAFSTSIACADGFDVGSAVGTAASPGPFGASLIGLGSPKTSSAPSSPGYATGLGSPTGLTFSSSSSSLVQPSTLSFNSLTNQLDSTISGTGGSTILSTTALLADIGALSTQQPQPQVDVTAVPEPSTIVLLTLGIVAFVVHRTYGTTRSANKR